MSDTDDMKRRARELCEAVNDDRTWRAWAMNILPALARARFVSLLARIEALEAERNELRVLHRAADAARADWQERSRRAESRTSALDRDLVPARLLHDAQSEATDLRARIEALEAERDCMVAERDLYETNNFALRARLAKYERVVESIRFDIDKAIGAHDPVDPRHRSHGGQHHNGPCCVLGNVPPGQIRTLREWRDALWSAMSGGSPEVRTLALCEQSGLVLRPDVLYRFVVMPGCAKCEEIRTQAEAT